MEESGTAGADLLSVAAGVSKVSALAGDDRITLTNADGSVYWNVTVDGGDGDDTLDASAVTSGLRLVTGNPSMLGMNMPATSLVGIEHVIGGAGDDIVAMLTTTAPVTVDGGAGNDILAGSVYTASSLMGGDGNDVLLGFSGNDTLLGGVGDDSIAVVRFRPGGDTTMVDGGEGTDTLYLAGSSVSLDLAAGNGSVSGTTVAVSGIENAAVFALGGDTTLAGDDGNNVLAALALGGGATGVTLLGRGGDDLLSPGRGTNRVDGGDGTDTLLLAGSVRDYVVTHTTDGWLVRGHSASETVVAVEQVSFDRGASALGMAAFEHDSFNAAGYLASYADLRAQFGTDLDAARTHWETVGQAQGLDPSLFDARLYGASNPDVARAYGNDPFALAQHYITYGVHEDRPLTSFDALEYAASNPDVARAFGTDTDALVAHYLTWGVNEHRATASFGTWEYAASNPDVFAAFGLDAGAIRNHYITQGVNEVRQIASFDTLAYAAANTDVAQAYGDNSEALAQHWLRYGQHEGRALSGFDQVAYLLSDSSLAGLDAQGALKQWVEAGVNTGAVGDALFGREQTSHALAFDTAASGAFEQAGDHDWFAIDLAAGRGAELSLKGADLDLYDATGHLLAHGIDMLDYTATTDGHYYVAAHATQADAVFTYSMTAVHL